MPVKKLTTNDAEKSFQRAVHHTEMATRNANFPMTREAAVATNNYAAATMQMLVALVGGVNDLLERVDRIEQQLQGRRTGGLPF
jgi:hypothetical protein